MRISEVCVSKSKLLVLGLAAAFVLTTGTQASAQTAPPAPKTDESPVEPATNVTLGYQYLKDSSWDENLLYGWLVTVNHRITRYFSIVGEVGGAHGKFGTTNFTIQRYAFLGGLRVTAGEGEVRPFFQFVTGYARQGGDVGLANGIAIQPGGGVDLAVNDWLTVRGQGDYRFLREDGEIWSQYRLSGGIVIYLGKKR
jgi:hypothetical protein